MKSVSIDGAAGGGQILRSSLTSSMLTGAPVVLERIRAGRAKPGLMRQHRMAVEAAATICGGEAIGAELGSQTLRFTPGRVRAGDYAFAIATAGSANLVLQTVLLPLVLADGPSTLTLEGGTHNPLAPPYEFIARTFLPVLARMGAEVDVALDRYGFMPAGGGRMVVKIAPASKLERIDLLERGALIAQRARALVANLPASIGHRQVHELQTLMGWNAAQGSVDNVASAGPGNILQIELSSAAHTEVFTAFGEPGKHSSILVRELVAEARAYLESEAYAGVHLADQFLLPFVIAGGGSFTTPSLDAHVTTNAKVLERFFGAAIQFDRGVRATTVRLST